MIQDNITAISNAMFRYPKQWTEVTDELKQKWFFMFNRYLSKDYPEQAFLLNDKSIDKVAAMDIWYSFLLNKPFPKHFWSKITISEKAKKNLFSEKDLLNLQKELNITSSEIDLLVLYNEDEVKEEIKYLKQLKEQNG